MFHDATAVHLAQVKAYTIADDRSWPLIWVNQPCLSHIYNRLHRSMVEFVQDKERAVLGKKVVAQRSNDGLFYEVPSGSLWHT